jgi:6-phosphogluconolactonase (cycloisomerase 2 family)
MIKKGMLTALGAGLLAAVTAFAVADAAPAAANSRSVVGYLYTSLNGEEMNQVVAFERFDDGSLGQQRAYPTGSKGGADRTAGGDAAGDFDSQGAIQIIEDYLLVVNAGGNTISVFDLDRTTGALSKRANVASGGTRPVSLTFVAKAGAAGQYWVVAGNQWNNPNVQKGGQGEGPVEMYPDAAFHAEGGGHARVLDDRNIFLFSFDARTGTLSPERRLDAYSGTNGGPTTVAFNGDGTRLAVATWGIAHFATATPRHQKPSRVYVYDFDRTSGQTSDVRYFEEEGVAGSIGFSWDPHTSNLFVSNFNLTADKRDHSLTVLADDGGAVRKVAAFGTGDGDDIDEACWTTLNADGSRLYVSSFGGNLISTFQVDGRGRVSKMGSGNETTYARRKAGTPPGDTKDMFISPDGRHMYVLGAYQTFTISTFEIGPDGTIELSDETGVEAAIEKGPGAYNFLGLTGFDH